MCFCNNCSSILTWILFLEARIKRHSHALKIYTISIFALVQQMAHVTQLIQFFPILLNSKTKEIMLYEKNICVVLRPCNLRYCKPCFVQKFQDRSIFIQDVK